VGEFGVGRTPHDRRVAGLEFREMILEGVQLGGADEREILGIEEEHDILLALVLIERELVDDLAVDHGVGLEMRSGFSYEN